ncbi:Methicillin resistance mecR1 protein [Planctomycetes bacterium Pla163]|uniref:Methicillin resistance mecR1 protein n=1 Tax=Rohdeia mirabilis TaxID=2528008 RepID=A0A518CVV0_9BACT|nr:Methicillin resistance mecR1 protein [Planctomycetes bacterium Pla163]
MSEFLLTVGLSNLLLSLVLGAAAWCVQRRGRTPWLAHLLWMLVLVKLVTPPLVTAPLFTFASDAAATTAQLDDVSLARGTGAGLAALPALGERAPLAAADPTPSNGPTLAAVATSIALWIWALGSCVVLVLSLARITRFARRLRASASPADDRLVRMATHLAKRLGLRRTPRLVVVDADLAPLVWWLGGRSEVVLPRAIVDGLDSRALRLVVAHELAHLRRRDHLVRWVEWAATVLFWWNPVLWLARRGLRENEELCCDALVLSALDTDPNTYATSLLDALELLATPALRPPVVASQMTSGGSLEHRLTMIVNASTLAGPSRRLRAVVLAVAALVLPLGIASAQAPDFDAVGARLMEAVEAGELSEAQARAMFGALAEEHFGAALESRRGASDRGQGEAGTLRDRAVEAKVLEAVERGLISREDAKRKLAELHRTVTEELPHEHMAELEQHYAQLQAELSALVKAGRISKSDAQQKLDGMRHELLGEKDMAASKKRYAETEARVRTMLESGWISKADAEAQLAELRQQLFGPDPMEVRKKRYAEAERRIGALLESGFMSKAEAVRELDEFHRELFGSADDAAGKKRYAEAEAKVKAAVGAGLMGPNEADDRLEALRLEIFGAPNRGSGTTQILHEIGYVDTIDEDLELLQEIGYVDTVVEDLDLLQELGYVEESFEERSSDTELKLLELETDVLEVEVDLLQELGYVEESFEERSSDTELQLLELETDVLEVEVDLLQSLGYLDTVVEEIESEEVVEQPVVQEQPILIEKVVVTEDAGTIEENVLIEVAVDASANAGHVSTLEQ